MRSMKNLQIILFLFLITCNTKESKIVETPVPEIIEFTYSIDTLSEKDVENNYCFKDVKKKIPLASISLSYLNLEGVHSSGELIVHQDVSQEVVDIFREIYNCGFRINKILPIYHYDCSDDRSMIDNNTSAFNHRTISGSRKLSDHSYGKAIDINPIFNPHIKRNKIFPKEGEDFIDRNKLIHGLIKKEDCVVTAFKNRGWNWGGDWKYEKDYQHFYKY